MDQVKLIAFLVGFENDIALLEGFALHIHHKLHRAYSCSVPGWYNTTPTIFIPRLIPGFIPGFIPGSDRA
jgi:hypothetical protein